MNYTLEAMVLSATNMNAMVDFYSNVFGVEFTMESVSDQKLYTGTYAELEFTLVPAELNQIENPQNPTHYDIYVDDCRRGSTWWSSTAERRMDSSAKTTT